VAAEASRQTNGGSNGSGARKFAATWPCRWSTAASGSRAPPRALRGRDADQQRADQPGPCVTATSSMSSSVAPAVESASSTTTFTSSTWCREAHSGTTPPKRPCTPWEDTTLASSSPARVTTAAHVSSHDVSMARIMRLRGRRRALPRSVAGVRHITIASSPLSW